MDLGKLAEEAFGHMMNPEDSDAKTTKKKTSTKKSTASSPLDSVVDSVDDAVKSKLPDGVVTDIAESTLDQNKDGHIVDDLLRMGENLINKKK